MKQILSLNPTFNPTSRTLDFSGYSGFSLQSLYAVLNVTKSQLIYAVGKSGYGYTAFAANVLTLQFDTSTMAAGDVLSVIYEVSSSAVTVSNTVPVTGPLTDTQLRATAVPVSGTVTANTGLTQPLTDAQLRATAVPVSAASLPLPSGASTETTLAALNTKTPNVGQTTMAGSRPVVLASDQSTIPVNQSGVSSTGSLAALNATVELSLNGATGFAVDLRGTFVATVTFQATIDGTNWFTVAVLPAGSSVNIASVTTATAAGAWVGNANGMFKVRAIATAFTSGSVTVTLRAMQAAGIVFNFPGGATTQAVSGTVTANIGTGALAAGTNAIGDVGIQYRANATGAATPASVLSPVTPAAASLKAAAGRVLGFYLQNSSTGVRSLKLYNATTVTLGTTAALFEVDIPAGGIAQLEFAGGLAFSTGIQWAVTAAKGLTDNTATGLAVNDVSGFIAWI